MKKYFNISLMMALFAMFTLCFTACSSDDDDDEKAPVPTITIKEANIEEGDIVCVQADIVAKGLTKEIRLTISGKDGKVKVSQNFNDDKYLKKLNIDDFHVHVNIKDKDVVEGDQLAITVTDEDEQSVTAKKDITAEEEDEDE